MSTSSEITRLVNARNTIRDKLIELGLATSTAKMDELAESVDGIINRGSVSATVQEGETYTIPAGWHSGSGTVSGVISFAGCIEVEDDNGSTWAILAGIGEPGDIEITDGQNNTWHTPNNI